MKRQKECMQTPAPRMHPASINSIFNYISINIYATAGPTSRLNQPSSINKSHLYILATSLWRSALRVVFTPIFTSIGIGLRKHFRK